MQTRLTGELSRVFCAPRIVPYGDRVITLRDRQLGPGVAVEYRGWDQVVRTLGVAFDLGVLGDGGKRYVDCKALV